MRNKKPEDKVRRSGRSGRVASRRAPTASERMRKGPISDRPDGSSRLLLTRLLREGAIWNSFIVTSASGGTATAIHLEFERKGHGHETVRYTARVDGRLLEALHTGGTLKRADLEQELERAIRDGEVADEESPASG